MLVVCIVQYRIATVYKGQSSKERRYDNLQQLVNKLKETLQSLPEVKLFFSFHFYALSTSQRAFTTLSKTDLQ